MKRVCKSFPGPQTLRDYISTHPDADWEQMRDDNAWGGYQAAHDCRDQAIRDQGGLCAYCEQQIAADGLLRCQVEHFHPKSDKTGTRNWNLDWENMLAVCDGGSRSSWEERENCPLPENLSCDAHKNHMVQTGKLPAACEGRLLNPIDVPYFPNLFAFDKGTGCFKPDDASCAAVKIPGNVYETTAELVNRTITALNLNCKRLADKRVLLVRNIDQNIETLRKKGIPPAKMPEELVRAAISTRNGRNFSPRCAAVWGRQRKITCIPLIIICKTIKRHTEASASESIKVHCSITSGE